MLTFLGASMLLATAPAVTDPHPKEERLIAATIAELPKIVAVGPRTRFRRVYVRRVTSREGVPQIYLCGQVDRYDPYGPDHWTRFASVLWGDEAMVHTRQSALVDVDTACSESLSGWDKASDHSARFAAKVRRRRAP